MTFISLLESDFSWTKCVCVGGWEPGMDHYWVLKQGDAITGGGIGENWEHFHLWQLLVPSNIP